MNHTQSCQHVSPHCSTSVPGDLFLWAPGAGRAGWELQARPESLISSGVSPGQAGPGPTRASFLGGDLPNSSAHLPRIVGLPKSPHNPIALRPKYPKEHSAPISNHGATCLKYSKAARCLGRQVASWQRLVLAQGVAISDRHCNRAGTRKCLILQ